MDPVMDVSRGKKLSQGPSKPISVCLGPIFEDVSVRSKENTRQRRV
jgi:hypothetical protein